MINTSINSTRGVRQTYYFYHPSYLDPSTLLRFYRLLILGKILKTVRHKILLFASLAFLNYILTL